MVHFRVQNRYLTVYGDIPITYLGIHSISTWHHSGQRKTSISSPGDIRNQTALENFSRAICVGKPISRVLYLPQFSLRQAVIIYLGRHLRAASSNLPGTHRDGPPLVPAWSCSRWGLPGRWCHHQRRCALTAPFHPRPWPI